MSWLSLLFWMLASPCFFVDQVDSGLALARFDDGRIEEIDTDLPEGVRVCDGRVSRPAARDRKALYHPLDAREMDLADLGRMP